MLRYSITNFDLKIQSDDEAIMNWKSKNAKSAQLHPTLRYSVQKICKARKVTYIEQIENHKKAATTHASSTSPLIIQQYENAVIYYQFLKRSYN